MAVPTAILISGVLRQVEDLAGRTSGLTHTSGMLTGVTQPNSNGDGAPVMDEWNPALSRRVSVTSG